jgi:hypothetical protein
MINLVFCIVLLYSENVVNNRIHSFIKLYNVNSNNIQGYLLEECF